MDLRDEHSSMAVVLIKGKVKSKVMMIKGRTGWIFPKGHVEDNETEEEAAIRECKEESGVDISNAERIGKVDEYTILIDAYHMGMSREDFYKVYQTDCIRKLISVYCFAVPFSQAFKLEKGFVAGQWAYTMDAFRLLIYDECKTSLSKALLAVSN